MFLNYEQYKAKRGRRDTYMEKKKPAQFSYDDSAQNETIQQISESYTSGEVAEQNTANQQNQDSEQNQGTESIFEG
jgi:hypothetical protein